MITNNNNAILKYPHSAAKEFCTKYKEEFALDTLPFGEIHLKDNMCDNTEFTKEEATTTLAATIKSMEATLVGVIDIYFSPKESNTTDLLLKKYNKEEFSTLSTLHAADNTGDGLPTGQLLLN